MSSPTSETPQGLARMNREKAQLVRLAIWSPIAIALLAISVVTNGWEYTWQWFRFLAITTSMAVAIAKVPGWM